MYSVMFYTQLSEDLFLNHKMFGSYDTICYPKRKITGYQKFDYFLCTQKYIQKECGISSDRREDMVEYKIQNFIRLV